MQARRRSADNRPREVGLVEYLARRQGSCSRTERALGRQASLGTGRSTLVDLGPSRGSAEPRPELSSNGSQCYELREAEGEEGRAGLPRRVREQIWAPAAGLKRSVHDMASGVGNRQPGRD